MPLVRGLRTLRQTEAAVTQRIDEVPRPVVCTTIQKRLFQQRFSTHHAHVSCLACTLLAGSLLLPSSAM